MKPVLRGDKGTFKGQAAVVMSASQPGVLTVKVLNEFGVTIKVVDILRRDWNK